jgi:hypothetical protein
MIAKTGGQLQNPERIPHDLWPAGELPPLPLVDRLTLILDQFDTTFRISPDGRGFELVPIIEPVELVHRYVVAGDSEQIAARLRELNPAVTIEHESGEVVITGREEDHETIRRLLAGQSTPGPPSGPNREATGNASRSGAARRGAEARYTLTVQNETLARVLAELESRLGLTFQWRLADAGLQEASQTKLVSFDVRQASLDELLRSVLGPAGLEFQRNGQAVEIRTIPD